MGVKIMKAIRITVGIILLTVGVVFFIAACGSMISGHKESNKDDSKSSPIVSTTIKNETTSENKSSNNNPEITLSEFNDIKTGMSYSKVVKIIGSKGSLVSEVNMSEDNKLITKIYTWQGSGSTGANANITFQGDKVVAKAQIGLE
jgi:hypothetical protein